MLCPDGKTPCGNIKWLCRCDCGNETTVASGKLVQGSTRSCGCLARDTHICQLEKHGFTTGGKPRTLIIWSGMKNRCYNPKAKSYPYYGGRGIFVCQEWMSFKNFHQWALANGYQDGLTLDRIDNDKEYSPSNCRWVSSTFNKKHQRKARYFSVLGITLNISDWCKTLRMSKSTAYNYLNLGESFFLQEIARRLIQ